MRVQENVGTYALEQTLGTLVLQNLLASRELLFHHHLFGGDRLLKLHHPRRSSREQRAVVAADQSTQQ